MDEYQEFLRPIQAVKIKTLLTRTALRKKQ